MSSHSHEHSHEHSHSHEHTGTIDDLMQEKKKRWEVVDRFQSRKGRKPTDSELEQLLTHGHTHEHLEHPGVFRTLPDPDRDFQERSFTIGVGGPVGSGKTALLLQLCKALREKYSIAAVTNDIFTREDGEFLLANKALPESRIRAVETGGCPHAAIREDISANLQAAEQLTALHQTEMILIESGGDNLAANFSRELADYIIYVIDVAGGDKVPRKGGPGITQADLLIVNKTDLAPYVGANLDVMRRDADLMRKNTNSEGDCGPTVFTQINIGKGIDEVCVKIEEAYKQVVKKKESTDSNKKQKI